jgi:predicted PurR-regulated permease PerM
MGVSSENFPKRVIAALALTALFALLLLILIQAINVLLIIFAGIILALLLRGFAEFISRKSGINVKYSLITVIISVIIFLTAAVVLIGPGVAKGVSNLEAKVPSAINELRNTIDDFGWGDNLIASIENQYDAIKDDPELFTKITGIFSSTIGVVISIVIIFVIGLYLAFDPVTYVNGIIKLIPIKKRAQAAAVLSSIANALQWWMVGQFLSMTVVGVLTYIGLSILNIPLAFTLSVIAFLFTFVPFAGPIASAVPAILVATIESPVKALYVIILYIAVQNFETYIITPLIQQRTVRLPAVLLIISQILVGAFLGVFGLLLAAPLMVVTIVIIQRLYVDSTLGDTVEVLGE